MNRRILVVDDNEAIHKDFRKILGGSRDNADLAEAEALIFGVAPASRPRIEYELDFASQGQEGVDLVRKAAEAKRPYAVAFVDMRMPPGIDGVETVERIWEADPQMQVVICSAYSDYSSDDLVERLGRSDQLLFLRKPFDNAEVCLLANGLTSKWNLARQASLRLAELQVLAEERTAKLSEEIAERRAAEERLRHLALHDSLTGLHNRAYLLEQIRRCLERRGREPDYQFAVLFMDLDNFKLINDSLGHDAGDEALVAAAQRVTDAIRGADTVVSGGTDTTARVGGDEFIVLLDGLRRASDAVVVAERIQQQLTPPFSLRGHDVTVSASIGIAVVDRPYDRPEDVVRDADAAMYRAKSSGKARYAIFDDRLHTEALARLKLENDLRRAVDQKEFVLVYEPIVTADTRGLIGFEALIRWRHPERGLIPPGAFISVAEETGLIVPIGHWVLKEACRQLGEWIDQHPTRQRLSISVNLSKRQVLEPGLNAFIAQTLREQRLDGDRLNLEITETSVMERIEPVAEVLRGLKRLGVKLHMDDFGTGLSSLACLHQFPIDVLKIDRSFIMNMTGRPQLAALVNAVLTLAHHMNIKVIAEGVETVEQLAQLRSLGCHYIQGYHVSDSLDAQKAGALITDGLHRWERMAA